MTTRFRIYKKAIICICILQIFIACPAMASEGELTLSGPLSVRLSYDAVLPAEAIKQVAPTEKKCTGGGMLGAINCVTEKMEGVGDSIDSAGNGGGLAGGKKIQVSLAGKLIPKFIETSEGQFEISLIVDIGMPEFSPSLSDIPADVSTRVGKDEGKVKLGLRKWHVTVTEEELKKNRKISYSLDEFFSNLSLFEVYAPKNPQVTIVYQSAECDQLQIDFVQVQSDYLQAMTTVPILEQFKQMTSTMDDINFALAGTAKGLEGEAGKIGDYLDSSPVEDKIEVLRKDTEGLSASMSSALEEIKEGVKQKREKLLALFPEGTEAAKKLQSGLKQSAETMKNVAAAIEGINERTKYMQTMLVAAEGRPSAQLKAFHTMYSDVQDKLSPLIKAIPVLGVFLDLYGQAIEQITDSVEQIEAEVDKRENMYKQAGGEFAARPLYIKPGNARQRLERQQNQLFKKLEQLKNRLVGECPGVAFDDQTYSEYQAIRDAGRQAENACKSEQVASAESLTVRKELKAARAAAEWPDWKRLKDEYNKKNIFIRNSYAAFDKISAGKLLSQEERAMLLNQFRAIYTEKKRIGEFERSNLQLRLSAGNKSINLSAYEGQLYRQYLNSMAQKYNELATRLNEEKPARDRYAAAQKAMMALNLRKAAYNACRKNYIQSIADQNNWSLGDLQLHHPDLFERGK